MACPPLDLKFFRRACTLCCGSPSKNSTLFSHNQLRTIAQRRKTRKKLLKLRFLTKSDFDFRTSESVRSAAAAQWCRQIFYEVKFELLDIQFNAECLKASLQCWAIADESAYLMTTWWLPLDRPDDCLNTDWWLPEDCLMTAWRLSDNCLNTSWWLLDDCLTTVW